MVDKNREEPENAKKKIVKTRQVKCEFKFIYILLLISQKVIIIYVFKNTNFPPNIYKSKIMCIFFFFKKNVLCNLWKMQGKIYKYLKKNKALHDIVLNNNYIYSVFF
jgi:hypothetical protein